MKWATVTEAEKQAALSRLAKLVEPQMPPWALIEPRVGERLHVSVTLEGTQNKLGRDVSVQFGARALERYVAMSQEHRYVAEARMRNAISERMREYDDGHAARRGAQLEPYVIDVGHIIGAD